MTALWRSCTHYSLSYGEQRLKRKPQGDKTWTRKDAFCHLIHWAMAHQQWFARALAELVLRYVEHCEDIVGQILARL